MKNIIEQTKDYIIYDDGSCVITATTLKTPLNLSWKNLKSIEAPNLISGYVDCYNNQLTSLSLPLHESGYVDCYNNQLTSLSLPLHESGDVYCYNNQLTSLSLPLHESGYVDCSNNQLTSLSLPLQKSGDVYCYNNQLTSLSLPLHESGDVYCYNNQLTDPTILDAILSKNVYVDYSGNVFDDGRAMFDGIACKVIRKLPFGVFVTDNKDMPYVVKIQGIYAHGKTIAQAKHDTIFKLIKADTSEYDNLTLDSVLTYNEAITMYRTITRACEAGTKNFIATTNPEKRSYTIREIIEKTSGQWGSEALQKFFVKGTK